MEKNQIEVRSKLNKAIEMIDFKINKIEEIKTSSYQTHGEFKWAPTSNYVSCKIHHEKDIHNLISIMASINEKKVNYEKIAKKIGLETFPSFKWQGIPAERWLFDLELRIKLVSQEDLKKELMKKKAILEKHLSEDDRLARTLSELGF